MPGFSIERRPGAASTWVLSGDLGAEVVRTAPTALTTDVESTQGDAHLDLHGLEFIGFDGVGLLVDLARCLAVHERRLVLDAPPAPVRRAFSLATIGLGAPADGRGLVVPPTWAFGAERPGSHPHVPSSPPEGRARRSRRSPAMHLHLDIVVRQADAGVVLDVAGDLDAATAPILDDALDSAIDCATDPATGGATEVCVDLDDVTFVDSSAIRVLVRAHRRLGADGRRLHLLDAPPNVVRVLQLSGLEHHFDHVDERSRRTPTRSGRDQ